MSTIHKAAGPSGRAVYRTGKRVQLLALLASPRVQAAQRHLGRSLNSMAAAGLVRPCGFRGQALLWVACEGQA